MDTTVMAEGNFLVPNGTFIAELIIFLIVLGVIGKFVVPPIRKALAERESIVAKTADDNHEAARQFAAAESVYRDELTAARKDAYDVRDEARTEGQRILDDMRNRAREESDAIQRDAETQLQQQGDAVAERLRPGIGKLSDSLASKVLGVDVTEGTSSTVSSGRG